MHVGMRYDLREYTFKIISLDIDATRDKEYEFIIII